MSKTIHPLDAAMAAEPSVRRVRRIGFALVLLMLLLSALYLYLAWNRYEQFEINKAINLGETVGALFLPETVDALGGAAEEIPPQTAEVFQRSLTRLRNTNADIAYAFVVKPAGNSLLLLAQTTQSPNFPTDSVTRQQPMIRQATLSGTTVYTGMLSWASGEWCSTLTPLRRDNAQPVAVLGITYPKAVWYGDMLAHMAPDAMMVLSVLILVLALYRIFIAQACLKLRSQVILRDEALFHSVFEQAPIGISIGGDEKVTYASPDGRYSVNPMFESILGRTRTELEQTDWQSITHPDDLSADLEKLERFKRNEIDRYTLEKRYLKPDGSTVWANLTISTLIGDMGHGNMHLCILEDITARKQMEQALQESERSKAVLLSHLPGLAYRCKYDENWTMEFVSEGCEVLTGYLPENLLYNRDISYKDLIASEYRDLLWKEWEQVLQQNRTFRYEYEIITKSGQRKWVLELGQFLLGENRSVTALEGIVIDISELKMRDAQITFMNEHDFLTGLFNRVHLEQVKKTLATEENFPLSVAVCDINGVRLVNDAFGPQEGDRLIVDTAHLLQSYCRPKDVLSRTGGDEYTLLMPATSESEARALLELITGAVTRANQAEQTHPYEVSLSFGLSTMTGLSPSIDQVIASAQEHLNHRKLLNQKSSHNAILSSIMATLYARSQETEEHGKRLAMLTRKIGERMCLDQNTLDDLELLSMLHDIGKVGVDDRILNKPARLAPDEWTLMKKHSEIGYRIALSTPELEHIANYILYHHEQWDGLGYPAGLLGEEIPLPARILTVADAYDAMTEDRVYRQAMPKADALAEISRCAGTQFDPEVARIFVALMQDEAQ